MSFYDDVTRAKLLLSEQGRVSVKGLMRELGLDQGGVEELIEEIVDVQGVAVRSGNVLVPPGPRSTEATAVATQSPAAELEPRARAPKHLTDKILQSKSALEGERKQVTVLFADVKGSMELAEQLDPEEWSAIMQRFFAILSEGVERFEGFVDKFTGDGIMALFGAPIAHEDHAQRACYAALYLRDSLRTYADELRRTQGMSLSVRIGINSGEVVVGKIAAGGAAGDCGRDLRMDYTAQGHTVGLAQRIEQCAAADSAYVSAHTARLVEGYFQLRDLGEFDLKGVGEPIRVHELQDVGALRTRLDSSRSRGFSKFVGRDHEMASLEGALESAIAGNGQVVGVMAEAGTGKSRLCLEFVERCKARGIRVNEAHCPAHGKTVPYLPLLEMLRDIFGIDTRDSDHEARRKIAGELMLLDEAFQSLLPILFEFMGVADPAKPAPPMSPEGRQQRLFAFVRHLVQARSEREASILFLDDVHWIDSGSDAFLAHAVEAAARTRTLWLVNFRPEYQTEWMTKSYYQQLSLRPLGPTEIKALLSDLLGDDPSVADLPDRVHERSGGNPFFIEEIIQALVENGSLEGTRGAYRLVTPAAALEIPNTVQSVLAARLDRLPEREKRLLQTASVIGKEFSDSLLAAVVESSGSDVLSDAQRADALATLARAEFVYEQALFPELEYAFKHPLTHEVAYRSQLGSRRAELHGAVARAIEVLHADKLDAQAALLAYHWELAGEATTAATWYARAAEAVGLDSPGDALPHYEKVRALLAAVPSTDELSALRLRAASRLLILGFRVGMTTDQVEEIYAEGKELAIARADAREHAGLLYGIGLHYMDVGDVRRSLSYTEEAVAFAEASQDGETRWIAGTLHEFNLILLGRFAEALQMIDRQVDLSRVNPAYGLTTIGLSTSDSYWHRGFALTELGRFQDASRAYDECDVLAARFDETEVRSWNAHQRSRCLELAGDAQAAIASARHAIELAEKVGGALTRSMAYGYLGAALALDEQWSDAAENLEHALELSRVHEVAVFYRSYFQGSLAQVCMALGDDSRARALAQQAIDGARRMGMPTMEARTRLAMCKVLAVQGGGDAPKQIAAALDRADALLRATGARAYEPMVLVGRAELAELVGDVAARERSLRRAFELFAEMGATGRAERVEKLLEREGRIS